MDVRNPGAVFLTTMAAAILVCAVPAAAPPFSSGKDTVIDCAIDNGSCSKHLAEAGITATFDITPKPVVAMKNLIFRIDLKEGSVPVTDGEVSLSLSMSEMTMAKNIVKLTHRGGGKYEGRGVIVKCPSGDRVWQAEACIKRISWHAQQPFRVQYTFRLK
ncbi:MAG: hypothetical protein A2V87_04835 [Deltaproteobacteria bacterium RBG_16_58_17]|nr:MAG: hypothetical protein A2V87_04835 [Deltaproteobacteria bacterium RBG_16_58_17]OHE21673.1 MAG: hypothetical protein A2X95_08275 [Syntrophobacterales bacterium GWF2_56_9]